MSPPQQTPGDSADTAVRMLVLAMVIGGAITIALAIYLGSTVDSFLYVIAAVGVVDFAVAWAYARGKLGPLAQRRREQAAAEPQVSAGTDPSENPYARED